MSNLALGTLARVEEIVTDVLAMDLLHSSSDFFRKVLEVAGETPDHCLIAIRRSVYDTSLGETDIELVVDGPDGKCGILIENKIRAPLMDRQFARYRMRGEAGIQNGQWSRFRVLIMSPRSYYEALAVEHTRFIDANLAYEDIVAFLADYPVFAFKRHVFQSAITEYRKGYVKSPDAAMTDFYHHYWKVASTEFPQLRMLRPDVVGRDGTWIYFPSLYAGNRVRLIHKFKKIGCELAVTTRNAEQLEEQIAPFLEPDMIVRTTKSMAFVNVKTPAINHILDFAALRTDIVFSLQTLDRLRSWAMNEQVRKHIVAVL